MRIRPPATVAITAAMMLPRCAAQYSDMAAPTFGNYSFYLKTLRLGMLSFRLRLLPRALLRALFAGAAPRMP